MPQVVPVLKAVVGTSGTLAEDLRMPRRQWLPGSPLLQIPDDVIKHLT